MESVGHGVSWSSPWNEQLAVERGLWAQMKGYKTRDTGESGKLDGEGRFMYYNDFLIVVKVFKGCLVVLMEVAYSRVENAKPSFEVLQG